MTADAGSPGGDDPGDLYDALAPVYDDWQGAEDQTPFADVVLDKLEPELRRFGGAPLGSFADFGCGTGTLLHALRGRHPAWRLCGVDASAAMLDVARGKPGADSIEWRQARLDEPPPPGPRLPAVFDAAGCFYDTLNHLPDRGALDRAMAAMAGVLRPGGLLVFDVTNERGFEGWWRGRRTWRGPDWRVTVEMTYAPARRQAEARVAVERGPVTRRATLVERCFAESEWRAAAAGAGLEVLAQGPWNPFPDDALGKTWVVTQKKTS